MKNHNFVEVLKQYLETSPREEILKVWEKSEKCDSVGITVYEYLELLENQITPKDDK